MNPTETIPPVTASDPEGMAATDPRRRRKRGPYKIRGPETWALIRESYLAGAPARDLAARYDVTEWAIWRRAWKHGWTKQDRVEPPPPPALEPVTPVAPPGAAEDPAALARVALRGLATALRQNRLAEARNLAQIVASLERTASSGGGDFTLSDMVRVIFDQAYQSEIMRVDPDTECPPEKALYHRLSNARRHDGGRIHAVVLNRGYAEGRAELRAELGLAPEPDRGDEWEYYTGSLVRRSVMDRKRQQGAERQAAMEQQARS